MRIYTLRKWALATLRGDCVGLESPKFFNQILSSHMTIPLGSISIMLLFPFMEQLCMIQKYVRAVKDVLSKG